MLFFVSFFVSRYQLCVLSFQSRFRFLFTRGTFKHGWTRTEKVGSCKHDDAYKVPGVHQGPSRGASVPKMLIALLPRMSSNGQQRDDRQYLSTLRVITNNNPN